MYAEEGKEKTINGRTYNSGSEKEAEEYAYAKVQQRDEEVYLEVADQDMRYEEMQTICGAKCGILRCGTR